MAVRQAAVAADNMVVELEGRERASTYDHEMMLVIDAGKESIFAKKRPLVRRAWRNSGRPVLGLGETQAGTALEGAARVGGRN